MTNRYDNYPTDALVDTALAMRKDLRELDEAVSARLIAESPVKIGKTYVVKPEKPKLTRGFQGQYIGRRIWVRYLRVERGYCYKEPDRLTLLAEGPLERPKPTNYGWMNGKYTSKHVPVLPERLDLSTEADP